MKNEVINVVNVTTDYSIFKFSKFNRNVILTKQYIDEAKNGFFSPIIVNENMVVIDGQHRLAASEKLGLPVEYIIKNGLDEKDIVRLNTVSRKWSITNFIEAFANDGKTEYQKLLDLIKEYGSPTVTTIVATNMLNLGKVGNSIKSGGFVFYNYSEAEKFLIQLREFSKHLGKRASKEISIALWELYKVQGFDVDRLIRKVIETGSDENLKLKTFSRNEAIKTLLDVYNNKAAVGGQTRIEYHINSMSEVIIEKDLKKWAQK